jgi:hypothetical protein
LHLAKRGVEEAPMRVGVGVAIRRQGNRHRQDRVRIEAGIDVAQPRDAPHQQSGADEQHDRHSDLRDQQRGAGSLLSRRGGAVTA